MHAVADDPKAVFLTEMARALHQAGIATDALEETLSDIAATIDLATEIFATPTQITIAYGPQFDQRIVLLRLDPGTVSLRKIAMLNDIYDRLRSGKINYQEAASLISTVDARWPSLSPWLDIPALALVAIGVAILLGGSWREISVAGCIGAFTGLISAISESNALVRRLFEVISAFSGTLIVALFSRIFGPTNIFIAIVAGIVVLLPGYSLTLALHELANQNLVAGVSRLGRVFSILLALGCGALLGFAVIGPSLLRTGDLHGHPVEMRWWALASVIMALGLSVDLDARVKDFVWVLAASFFALFTSHLLNLTPVHNVSSFIAAFICGIIANLGARYTRAPQALMLVPALLVLVPGSLSYESVLFAFQHNISSAFTFASNAIFAAIQLVAGLLLSQLLFPARALRVAPRIGRSR